MVQTYSNDNNIYSVDMMFAYISIFKPKSESISIDDTMLNTLKYKGWGNPRKGDIYSAMDVIKNYKKKKYQMEIQRIVDADLKYPIIMYDKYIVDGVHRLTKAHLAGDKKIKVYKFSKNIMKKFLINNNGDWDTVDNMKMFDFIKLFYERFVN